MKLLNKFKIKHKILIHKKYLSPFPSPLSPQQGISMVELLMAIGLFTILSSLSVLSLLNSKHAVSLDSSINVLIADLKEQQIKAMVGDTEGSGTTPSNYGIHFNATSYTLFRGTYVATSSANFKINLPDTIQVSSTFPSAELIFLKGSGELNGYLATQSAVTVSDSTNTSQKTVIINRYGVVTGVN